MFMHYCMTTLNFIYSPPERGQRGVFQGGKDTPPAPLRRGFDTIKTEFFQKIQIFNFCFIL